MLRLSGGERILTISRYDKIPDCDRQTANTKFVHSTEWIKIER